MATIPTKVQVRLNAGMKKFQAIARSAKAKDINESDTVVIISDILSELFGYDKYSEITSEYAIKKTYCDLAIKVDNKIRFIIEVKAAGLELKDDHIKQAVDYGANLGVDWVVLTNSNHWKVFKITFGKPIQNELVYEFDLTEINPKKEADLEMLYCLSKESLSKAALEELHVQKQMLSKFFIGQVLLSEPITDAIRKTLRKIAPEVKITSEEIREVIQTEVIKREVLEGAKTEAAKKKISKSLKELDKKEEVGINATKPLTATSPQ